MNWLWHFAYSPTDYQTGLPQSHASGVQIHNVLQIVLGILAALAVLMIVIAGLRFITAQGNPQETAKARGTIVYALIGLVLAMIAEGFVSFVLDKL
jgi:type IV secretory pathway VirB2 component (pilin)